MALGRGPVATALSLVFLTLSLAGCSSGGDSGDEADPASQSAESVGTGSATLRVLVTDDESLPLPGASVAISEIAESLRSTDEGGVASFEGLEPGAYTLNAYKLGFESLAQRVEVLPEQENTALVVLPPLAISDSYYVTKLYDGFFGCGMGLFVLLVSGFCPAAVAGDTNVAFYEDGVTIDLMTIIDELEWQQTTALSAQELLHTIISDDHCRESTGACNVNPDHTYGSAAGPSPLYVPSRDYDDGFPGFDEVEGGTIVHRTWTPGSQDSPPFIIVVFQQPYTIYSTSFFGDTAPEGFSARPDA